MVQFSGEHGGGLSFSALAIQTFRRSSPPLRHPRESGDPEEGEREKHKKLKGNAINRIIPNLDSRFRGNDEKRECVYTPM
jgi:hypothetical protein